MKECTQAFESLKAHLASALDLGLPNLIYKVVYTFINHSVIVQERQGITPGVFTQMLSDILQPITHLSRKLSHTLQGWPACLRAVTAACELLQEAANFPWDNLSPHQVLSLLEQKGNLWLTAGKMGRYQAILLGNPNVSLTTVS